MELAYAIQNDLPWAAVRNKSGKFIEPSLDSATAAATGVPLPDDMKVLLTDSSSPDAYPIVGFTWVLAYVNQRDKGKGQAVVYYLWRAIHDGQQFTTDLLTRPCRPMRSRRRRRRSSRSVTRGSPCSRPRRASAAAAGSQGQPAGRGAKDARNAGGPRQISGGVEGAVAAALATCKVLARRGCID